jgi:hypothetical protein
MPVANRTAPTLAVLMLLLLAGCGDGGTNGGGTDADSDADGDTDADTDADTDSDGDTDTGTGCEDGVTASPETIDDVLVNPGMGLADFHFGWWCNLPPLTYSPEECSERVLAHWPENHPGSATAYFRWTWREIEPVRGEIDFEMIDTAIRSANALGSTLAFRIMTVDEAGLGVPDWLLEPPYSATGAWRSAGSGSLWWPDYRDAAFQAEHQRLVEALAGRYDGHPAVDHVDLGSVGCWGEWNTACLDGAGGIIEVYAPADDAEREEIATAYRQLVDHFLDSFQTTPLVMLGLEGGLELEVMLHAVQGGAGWRVDCWGDYGIFGGAWNHMEDLYPQMISAATAAWPGFPDVWRHAPVQLEVCGTLPGWHDLGWTADAPDGEVVKAFAWALEQHASVLNAKWTPVPADYGAALDDLLEQNGYRLVLDELKHCGTAVPGEDTTFVSTWTNAGVAPPYLARTLVWRLRQGDQPAFFPGAADIRDWVPGSYQVTDVLPLPVCLEPGTYDIDVAIVDRAGLAPATEPLPPLHLGIASRDEDGWYRISEITVL